jgi:hypothetical protein
MKTYLFPEVAGHGEITEWVPADVARELLEALQLAVKQITDLDEVLNQSGHEVIGWHLNGDTENVTNFFAENDHDAVAVAEKAIKHARGES